MRRIIDIVLCFIVPISLVAQIPQKAGSMLSPNAAQIAEYGDVPVSYFTGVPHIEIPLYNVEIGGRSMPISLSYHAGCVRPDTSGQTTYYTYDKRGRLRAVTDDNGNVLESYQYHYNTEQCK